MFFQLIVDDLYRDHISDFEAALQKALLEIGEREGSWGPFRLPVSEAEHLVAIGQLYIRVYQHRLTRHEMEQLVGQLSEQVWGKRNVCRIEAVVGTEPNS